MLGKKKFGIISAIEFKKILDSKQGTGEFEKIKNQFTDTLVTPASFETVSGMLGQGYIIMSSINHFTIDESETSQDVWIHKEKGMESATEVTHTSRSTIAGRFAIFEIETGKPVFTADHEVTDINTRTHTERGCFDGLIAGIAYAFVPVTATGPNEMVEKFYKQIIANIPKK